MKLSLHAMLRAGTALRLVGQSHSRRAGSIGKTVIHPPTMFVLILCLTALAVIIKIAGLD
jgi:hypothetical protein